MSLKCVKLDVIVVELLLFVTIKRHLSRPRYLSRLGPVLTPACFLIHLFSRHGDLGWCPDSVTHKLADLI